MPKADELRALVEKSQQTDIQALLSAKEQAKRAMLDDPSSINVSAFEKSSRLLEDFSNAGNKKFKRYKRSFKIY